jgi:hypothetical protein
MAAAGDRFASAELWYRLCVVPPKPARAREADPEPAQRARDADP